MSEHFLARITKQRLVEFADNNTIIVLKGVPFDLADESQSVIRLEDIIKDKLGYFSEHVRSRRVISYEEFLLLEPFVIAQYKEVIILNNNLYMEQYPIDEVFTEEIRTGLLNHFSESEEENDESFIGDIDEYTSIFQGIKEVDGKLVGVYSEPSSFNSKVRIVNLLDYMEEEKIVSNSNNTFDFDIIEESDYISFLSYLYSNPSKVSLRISNYRGSIDTLKRHLGLALYYWNGITEIRFTQVPKDEAFEHKPEYREILKKYWGHDKFRDISVYDMQALEKGEKCLTTISQERIISDLVEEVEHCIKNDDYRDIFVTAPTGAGKSAMFQIPAIHLAEKHSLLTIVISPLIGLMNDQVKNLEVRNYRYARTINSDISPIVKQDIIEKVGDGQYHILYISPETLLSRSDVEELIGDRTIGMIVIDEAHIVTTWGKQFRPDYWYLGDHIRKLRKKQLNKKGMSFVIATFTATAIYHGFEDMYTETINSLNMLNPITYLGYVKRDDIDIVVKRLQKEKNLRFEYELEKFKQIEELLKRVKITGKKTLVYFPTVALITRCYEYLQKEHKTGDVAVYYGTLDKDLKQANYGAFLAGEKHMMLATKAFGMGIDIDDIEIVMHFAPTGNVCDYVQEIGRAARRPELRGEACYNYNPMDFKHINRLHGMSAIRGYQLVKVIEKIDDLYKKSLDSGNKSNTTKKRNAMLLDAENFSYIFESSFNDENDAISKVKTALLLIQKDFENKIGFSPINVRPIPMFSSGFFEIDPKEQSKLTKVYPNAIEVIDSKRNICRVLLSDIWGKDFRTLSFPKFKYLLYSRSDELDLNNRYRLNPALCVNVNLVEDYRDRFSKIWNSLKNYIYSQIRASMQSELSEMISHISNECGINKYKAQTICEVVITSMSTFRKGYSSTLSPIVKENVSNSGKIKYQFNVAVNSYLDWVEKGFQEIVDSLENGVLYLLNDISNRTKELSIILGILESMGCLSFEMVGGANSQIFIYVNQIQALKNIINAPDKYHNRMLEMISARHELSVKMLTYLYENDFSSEERWDLLEDYFLGKIPEKVLGSTKK